MHRTMMPSTEGDRELIADLAAERARLGKSEVVGIGWLAAADEARLLGDVTQVFPVAIAARRSHRQGALVDALGLISTGAFDGDNDPGPGNLRHRRRIVRGCCLIA